MSLITVGRSALRYSTPLCALSIWIQGNEMNGWNDGVIFIQIVCKWYLSQTVLQIEAFENMHNTICGIVCVWAVQS